jgi:hypothetical protein
VELLESNRSKSHGKQHAVRFQAATTQLDLAITFYLIAAATRDQDRSDRAIANAEQAYANAASSLDCNLKAGQNLEIEEKLVRLNSVRAGCPANALFLSSSLNGRGRTAHVLWDWAGKWVVRQKPIFPPASQVRDAPR